MLNSNLRNILLAGASASLILSGSAGAANASNTINVAVASNFYGNNYPTTSPIASVISAFVALNPSYNVVVTSHGASGDIFNSITGGNISNVDVVFFADNTRAATLAQSFPATVTNQPFDYALGELVLWTVNAGLDISEGFDWSDYGTGTGNTLAVANPNTAPYGNAARFYLQSKGVWDAGTSAGTIQTYNNVELTYAAVAAGTARAGFVALSQVCAAPSSTAPGTWPITGKAYAYLAHQYWDMDSNSSPNPYGSSGSGGPMLFYYPHIIQSAIRVQRPTALTTGSTEYTIREAFIAFMRDRSVSSTTRAPVIDILASFCYGVPS